MNTLQEDDGLGKGGVAWLNIEMLTFGFTPCHTTQPLYFSARSHSAGKKCSNFVQLGDCTSSLGLQLPGVFVLSCFKQSFMDLKVLVSVVNIFEVYKNVHSL